MPLPFCASLEALPTASNGRSDARICHGRLEKGFKAHRGCGVASVRKGSHTRGWKSRQGIGCQGLRRDPETSVGGKENDTPDESALQLVEADLRYTGPSLDEVAARFGDSMDMDNIDTSDDDDDDDNNNDNFPCGMNRSKNFQQASNSLQKLLKLYGAAQKNGAPGEEAVESYMGSREIVSAFAEISRGKSANLLPDMDHPMWEDMEKIFISSSQEFDIQKITTVLLGLGKMKHRPNGLTSQVFQRLKELSPRIQNAGAALIEPLAFSMSRCRGDVDPVVVRIIQEKVIRGLPDYSATEFCQILCTLSYLNPPPAPGMVMLCWDHALEIVPFAPLQALSSLLRAMVRIDPAPPQKLDDVVFERCSELASEMPPKILARTMYWIYKSGLDRGKQIIGRLDDYMIAQIKKVSLSSLHQWLLAYVALGRVQYASADILVRQLLTHDDIGPMSLGNAMQLLSIVKHRDKSLASAVADRARAYLHLASPAALTKVFSGLEQLDVQHEISLEIIRVLDDQAPRLSPVQVLRVVNGVCTSKTIPARYKELVQRMLTREVAEGLTVDSLLMLVDSMARIDLKNQEVTGVVLEALTRDIHHQDITRVVVAMKQIMSLGNASKDLLAAAKPYLVKYLESCDAVFLSHCFETLAMLSRRRIYDKELMGIISQRCLRQASEFSTRDLNRVLRWMARTGITHPVFVGAMAGSAEEKIQDMVPVEICWTLWSMGQINHKLSDAALSFACAEIDKHMMVLRIHDVCRFMYGCGRMEYKDEGILQKLSEYISTEEIGEIDFSGVAAIARSFARLEFVNENLVRWMKEKIPKVLDTATPKAISNLMLAFRALDFNPTEECLEQLANTSRSIIETFKPFELSITAQCLSKFGADLNEEFVTACSNYLEQNLNDFDALSSCSLIGIIGKEGYTPSQEVVRASCQKLTLDSDAVDLWVFAQYVRVLGQSGYQPSSLLKEKVLTVRAAARKLQPATLSAVIQGYSICQYVSQPMVQSVRDASFSRLQDFEADDFAGLVWSLANLGYKEEQFFSKAALQSVDKLDNMTATELVTLLWSFARADRPAEAFVAAAFERLSAGDLKHLSAPQLVSLGWAIARLSVYNESLMIAFADCVDEHHKDLRVKGISTILWTFATVGYNPGDLFEKLLSRIGMNGLEQFPDWLSLTHMLWSCSRLLHRPPQNVIDGAIELLRRTEGDIRWKGGQRDISQDGGVEARHLSLCLWSLAVFGMHRTELVKGMAARANHLDILEDMNKEDKQQIAQVILTAEKIKGGSPLREIPQHYIDEAMLSWQSMVRWNAGQEPSLFHQSVVACLLSAGVKFEEYLITADKCMVLEIFVPFQLDAEGQAEGTEDMEVKGAAIELYGDQYLLVNTQKPTGKVVLRQQMLKDRGYQVIPLLFPEWKEELRDLDQQEKYLVEKLVSAGVLQRSISDAQKQVSEPGGNFVGIFEEEDLGAFVDALEDEVDWQEMPQDKEEIGSGDDKKNETILDTAL